MKLQQALQDDPNYHEVMSVTKSRRYHFIITAGHLMFAIIWGYFRFESSNCSETNLLSFSLTTFILFVVIGSWGLFNLFLNLCDRGLDCCLYILGVLCMLGAYLYIIIQGFIVAGASQPISDCQGMYYMTKVFTWLFTILFAISCCGRILGLCKPSQV